MNHFSWKTWFQIGITLFILWLATIYWPMAVQFVALLLSAAAPLLIGLIIAYIVNLLMSFYERQSFFTHLNSSSRRVLCMLLAMISFVAIVVGIVGLVIPELTSCIQLLLKEVPGFIDELLKNQSIQNLLPENVTNDLNSMNWREFLNKIAPMLTTGISTIGSLVSSIFSTIVTFLISLIFSIYLLLHKETLQRQLHRVMKAYLKPHHVQTITDVLAVFHDCFYRYLVGQCTEAVILGILCALGMLLFRFPYAVMIGTLIGFTALIPVAGAYIGALVGAVMILTVSPVQAVFFLLFIVVLQQLEGNLIYPKVVGSSLGLPALWVLAAVTIGGGVLGISGMLLGVPITAALYRLLKEDVLKKEKTHQAIDSEKEISQAQ